MRECPGHWAGGESHFCTRLADLLARTAAGELPARVHAVVSLDQAADAHRATAQSGLRGPYIICP
ncbi:hypothetical protein ACWD3K_26285 [Streptomyces sp. NPDC002778]